VGRRNVESEGGEMNDDDTDAGGDFFVDFIKTVIAIFFFVLFVSIMGSFVWGLIA
jgi:hypothetical protein